MDGDNCAKKSKTEKGTWGERTLQIYRMNKSIEKAASFVCSRNSKRLVWLDKRGEVVRHECQMSGGARLHRGKLSTIKMLTFMLRKIGRNWEVFSREIVYYGIYFNRIPLAAVVRRYCFGGWELGGRVGRTEISKTATIVI